MVMPLSRTVFTNKARQTALDATTQKINTQTVATQKLRAATVSFSGAQGRGTITMENFGRTFSNATRKVLMWQLAIMAVYGVIRKVSETIQTWKDLEVTLARISITTEAVGGTLQKYFTQVADIAIKFGMPIEQTLTGMDLALRATARYADQANRGAIAIDLLSSASALGNITGMQFSQAIDILVGSLRQSDMELDEGITLLDKWVAVAKKAAVSVNDLSQGFAIMADAGRAAGMTVDQINGLIAALSETVTLGPVQIGNAIRALMSTLYNPGSIALLQKYGVAVRDTSGEVRSFWDVLTQLSSMKLAGVLDESVWLEIAKAAGAGQRRYAQFLALLNNFTSAMRAAEISSKAEGEAMEANRLIVETLTNTWDKFTAAQRKFLFNLGEETGMIDNLTSSLQGLTDFFNTLAGASDSVYRLGRAVMFLVGTLAALKITTLAMGWMGVGPKVGALMGRFAGVPPTAVAGSAAYAKAIQTGGYTTAQKAAEAGLGTVAPGLSSQAGVYALSGLLPMMLFRRMWGGAPAPRIPGTEATKEMGGVWRPGMGTGRGGGRWTAPPVVPMTWGGVGRGVGGWLTRPMGGMGKAIGGLAMGAAAYGLTGEWQSAVGAGIGAAVGATFGPLGMVIGGSIGGVIGHTAADAFISEEDRIRGIFKGISEEFTVDLSSALEEYFGKDWAGAQLKQLQEGLKAGLVTPEEYRKRTQEIDKQERALSRLAAPSLPEERLVQAQPLWKRLLFGGVSLGGPISPANQYAITPFGRPEEKDWTSGLGALNEVNEALNRGVITIDQYREATRKGYIVWEVFTEMQKAVISMLRDTNGLLGENASLMDLATEALSKQMDERRKFAKISDRYSESQVRIKQLMSESGLAVEGLTLKEWEQYNVNELLADQTTMSTEKFAMLSKVLFGSAYGYGAHLEAIEALRPMIKELGGDFIAIAEALTTIPSEKWLDIQRYDPALSTKIGETVSTLRAMDAAIDAFAIKFPDILTLSGIEGTITDIGKVEKALSKLKEATPDNEALKEAWEAVVQYMADFSQKQLESRKMAAYGQIVTYWQRETQVRLVDADTLKAYRESLGRLPAFTELAKSLNKTAGSVLTLVDPITGEMLRLEENTLALEMLSRFVGANTTALEKRLEAEYNLPGGYQRPGRYWAMKTLQPTTFGPMQESLWQMWEEFVQNRSMQGGGVVRETGPYFLHKQETVISDGNLQTTNNILNNSYKVLMISSGYLSSINLGIAGLRQEIAGLRGALSANKGEAGEEFSRVARSNYSGVSSLGVSMRR